MSTLQTEKNSAKCCLPPPSFKGNLSKAILKDLPVKLGQIWTLEKMQFSSFFKSPMLRFVTKLRHSFFLGHPCYEDWLSQVIMAALNIKTMKFSSNFSDSVEEPSEIMDNSRPNGVRSACHNFHRCPYCMYYSRQQ